MLRRDLDRAHKLAAVGVDADRTGQPDEETPTASREPEYASACVYAPTAAVVRAHASSRRSDAERSTAIESQRGAAKAGLLLGRHAVRRGRREVPASVQHRDLV